MPNHEWIYPEHDEIADWSKQDLEDVPGWDANNVAAYQCIDCQAIVPVTFCDCQPLPIPVTQTAVCWTLFGGCGEITKMNLVSDGYLWNDNESNGNTNESDDS